MHITLFLKSKTFCDAEQTLHRIAKRIGLVVLNESAIRRGPRVFLVANVVPKSEVDCVRLARLFFHEGVSVVRIAVGSTRQFDFDLFAEELVQEMHALLARL